MSKQHYLPGCFSLFLQWRDKKGSYGWKGGRKDRRMGKQRQKLAPVFFFFFLIRCRFISFLVSLLAYLGSFFTLHLLLSTFSFSSRLY